MRIFINKKIFLIILLLILFPSLVLSSSKNVRDSIVNFALSQEGKLYHLGSYGPNKWDCSSLVNYAYNKAGVSGFTIREMPNPHGPTAQQQYKMSESVSILDLLPGDLLFEKSLLTGRIVHVGMYIGNGKSIEAAYLEDRNGNIIVNKVTIYPLSRWTSSPNFAGARRVKKEFWPNQDNGYSEEITQNENKEESLVQNIPWWKKIFCRCS